MRGSRTFLTRHLGVCFVLFEHVVIKADGIDKGNIRVPCLTHTQLMLQYRLLRFTEAMRSANPVVFSSARSCLHMVSLRLALACLNRGALERRGTLPGAREFEAWRGAAIAPGCWPRLMRRRGHIRPENVVCDGIECGLQRKTESKEGGPSFDTYPNAPNSYFTTCGRF